MKTKRPLANKGPKQEGLLIDSPDDADALENIPQAARGYEETLVAVDNPDDFADEGEEH